MEDPRSIETQKVQLLRAHLQKTFLQEQRASTVGSNRLTLQASNRIPDLDDKTLRRFLRARSCDVDKAFKFLVQHLNWACTFKPLGYIPESEIVNEMRKEKIYLQGEDKHGRPIGVILAGQHFTADRNLEEFKRFVVYGFDKAVASLSQDQEKFVLIADLKGYSLRNMDMDGYSSVLKILQDHYPERLGKLYFLNAPSLFFLAWRVVHRLIDPNVREKIVFVDDKRVLETLLNDIDSAQLPDKFGGKLPMVPIQCA